MNVLIIGEGARESAILHKVHQSPKVSKIYIAPGNGGTESIAENIDISIDDFDKLTEFVKAKKIDLTIVGPEIPLNNGIVDHFESLGLNIFGPSKTFL